MKNTKTIRVLLGILLAFTMVLTQIPDTYAFVETADASQDAAAAEESSADEAAEEETAETAEDSENEEGTDASEEDAEAADEPAVASEKESKPESEEAGEAAATKSEYVYEDKKVKVTAALTNADAIPDDAELIVTLIDKKSDDYNYQAYLDALNEDSESGFTESNTLLYDIAFIEDGVEVQPASGKVSVSFEFLDDQLKDSIGASKASDVNVIHLPLTDKVKEQYDTTADAKDIEAEDINVEEVTKKDNDLKVSVRKEKVKFELDSFSGVAFSSPDVDEGQEGQYTVKIKFVDADGDAVEPQMSGNYYTIVEQDNNYYYKKLESAETITITEFTNGSSIYSSKIPYDNESTQTVSIVSRGDGREFESWNSIYTQYPTYYEEGDAVGNYIIDSIKTNSDGNFTVVTLKEKALYKVNVHLFDFNKIDPYTDGVSGNKNYYIRVKATENETGKEYYTVIPIDLKNTYRASVTVTGLIPLNDVESDTWRYNGEVTSSTTGYVAYDSSKFTIEKNDVRLINGNIYSDKSAFNADDSVDGFIFKSNAQDLSKLESNISLRRCDTKYDVNLYFSPEGTDIASDDLYYLFIDIEHQSSGHSYYLKKLEISADSLKTDDEGRSYCNINIPNWMDGNGSDISDSFTGNESAITVYLLKADQEINMNNAINGNHNSRIAEGGLVKNYAVSYGARIKEESETDKARHYIDTIYLKKTTPTSDFNYKSILGPGISYGVTADRFQPKGSDIQSNFAANYFQGSNSVNPNLAGNAGALAIANFVKFDPDIVHDPHNEYTDDPTGQINIAESGVASPIIVYTDSEDRIEGKESRQYVNVIETPPQDVSDNIVEPIISHMENISSQLAACEASVSPQYIEGKVVIDSTSFGDDATIYVDADEIAAAGELFNSASGADKLVIKKKEGQTIVFNFTSTETVVIDQFAVEIINNDGTVSTGNSAPNTSHGTAQNELLDKKIAPYIVWNLNSAKDVEFNSPAGIFLIPNENSYARTEGSTTGWLITDGYFETGSGEWHYVYADLESSDVANLYAYKKVNDIDASSDEKFEFKLERYDDGEWKECETEENDGSLIHFQTDKLENGWNIFKITESKIIEAQGSFEENTQVFYAAVKYSVVSDEIKIAGTAKYYTAFDASSFDPDAAGVTGVSDPVEDAKAVFLNEGENGDLSLEKIVAGTSETGVSFAFEIKVTYSDEEGVKPVSGLYNAVITEDGKDDITRMIRFGEGIADVRLTAGQKITIKGLPAGSHYEIEEISSENYVLKDSTNTSGDIAKDSTQSAQFVNTVTGSLKVKKTVESSEFSDYNIPFSFTVTLEKPLTGTYGEMTFTDGTATFTLMDGESLTATGLPVGMTYEVTEDISAYPWLGMTKEGDKGEVLKNGATAAFTNTRADDGELSVTKTVKGGSDSDKSKSFDFHIELGRINGTYGHIAFTDGVATVTTAAGKTISATGLPDHLTYKIYALENSETDTAFEGAYGSGSSSMTFTGGIATIESDDGTVYLAEDLPAGKSFRIELLVVGVYGDIEFKLDDKNNSYADLTLTDGETKKASGLPLGVSYSVTEKQAGKDGFETTSTGDTGTVAATNEVEFINSKTESTKGKITLTKTGENSAKLAGAEFDLYRVKTGDETEDVKINTASLVTDGQGKIAQEDLEPGDYYFVETKAPAGYVTPTGEAAKTETKTIAAGQTETPSVSVTKENTKEGLGQINLIKSDKVNGNKLSGAEFSLYKVSSATGDSDTLIEEKIVTNAEGVATATNLGPGTYYFVETKAPAGYILPTGDDAKSETATVDSGQAEAQTLTVNMTNAEEAKGEIILTKTGENSAKLAGAEFDLYRVKTGDETEDVKINTASLVTDGQGKIAQEDLEPGDYYFVETKAPAGYVTPTGDAAKTETKTIAAGQKETPSVAVTMTNTKEGLGQINLIKSDKVNGNKLSGAEFSLYKVSSATGDSDTLIEEKIVTNAEGVATATNLGPGTYYFVETKAPAGYILPTGDDAKSETATVDSGQAEAQTLTVNMTNAEEAKGEIILTKTGENSAKLAGAEFDLYRVKTGDETEDVKINTASLVTDGQGKIAHEDLEPGDYYFVETKAPAGYVTPTGDAAKTETKTIAAGQKETPSVAVTMTNTKEAKGEAVIQAQKKINKWPNGKSFKFRLTAVRNSLGANVPTPMPAEAGSSIYLDKEATQDEPVVDFGNISYSKPGTYWYYVSEIIPDEAVNKNGDKYGDLADKSGEFSLDGVIYENMSHNVIVTVNDDMEAEVVYGGESGGAQATTIENEYAAEGTAEVKVTKSFNNWGDGDEFTFVLEPASKFFVVDDKTSIDYPMPDGTTEPILSSKLPHKDVKAKKDAKTASFGEIKYTVPGTYTYYIHEDLPSGVDAEHLTKNGITYDAATYTVTVKVEDDNKGNLNATVTYDGESALTVGNAYATSGTAELKAKKEMKDFNYWGSTESFTFDLAAVSNTAKDYEGKDVASPMPAGTENGVKSVTVTKSTTNLTALFGEMEFTYPGEYTYTITEQVPEGAENNVYNGVTYDPSAHTVKVKADDTAHDGTMTITVDYGAGYKDPAKADPVKISNTYSATGEIVLSGTKTFTNGTLTEGAFTFSIYRKSDWDAKGAAADRTKAAELTPVKTASVTTNGSFAFDAKRYELADITSSQGGKEGEDGLLYKDYEYVVVEDIPDTAVKKTVDGETFYYDAAADIKYDATVYPVTITVKDKGDGTLDVKTSDNKTSFGFENKKVYTKLYLTKSIDKFIGEDTDGEYVNATMVFNIKYKDPITGEDTTRSASVTFDKDKVAAQTAEVEKIPIDATVEVTEVYSSNYKPGTVTVSKSTDDNGYPIWTATCDNTQVTTVTGSGVINSVGKNSEGKYEWNASSGEPKN